MFLLAQLGMIARARFVAERFFCWAPFDEQTHYTISVALRGRILTPEEITERYHVLADNWNAHAAANVIMIVHRYETTYGRNEGAEVTVRYSRNGHAEQTWQWPKR